MSSDDLSEKIEETDGRYAAWCSADDAEGEPRYQLVGMFATRQAAEDAL